MPGWYSPASTYGASIRLPAVPAATRNWHRDGDGRKTVTSAGHGPPGKARRWPGKTGEGTEMPGEGTEVAGEGRRELGTGASRARRGVRATAPSTPRPGHGNAA